MGRKVLLHICCGVCAFGAIELLRKQDYYVEGLFFNPNVYPREEYLRRKAVVDQVADVVSLTVWEEDYDPSIWFDICGEYKNEPEGGRRCLLCYELRLKKVYQVSQENKFDYFTTTLTISPHKDSKKIAALAEHIGGGYFLPIDFKQNNGFKRTIQLSKQHNFYRQNYCGCMYSMKVD